MAADIDTRISQFQEALRTLVTNEVVRKRILFANPYLLEADQYYDLRHEISEQFQVHPSEVFVVGSAQLGFSIAPKKRYRHFSESSDIDVALVAPKLFDQIWTEVYDFQKSRPIWPEMSQFAQFLLRGWIRPDKLPRSKTFGRSNEWFEFFRTLTATGKFGDYKIRAGLYKAWNFLEGYQSICVNQCKSEIT